MNWTRIGTRGALLSVASLLCAVPLLAAPSKYETVSLEESGTIVGSVLFEGTAPAAQRVDVTGDEDACHKDPIPDETLVVSAKRGVKWAVASLKKAASGKAFPAEDPPPTFDQKGCRFTPHVVVVPAARKLRVLNSDGILHNVHIKGRRNKPVNTAMPGKQESMDLTFKRPDRMPVSCDIHPWMAGWIVVSDNPYFVVTGDDGSFRLEKVPVGTHKLQLWHEKLGTHVQDVTVEANQETKVEFSLALAK